MKRTIEEVLTQVRRNILRGDTTFKAFYRTLSDEEWNDLLPLIERLQAFYVEHTQWTATDIAEAKAEAKRKAEYFKGAFGGPAGGSMGSADSVKKD